MRYFRTQFLEEAAQFLGTLDGKTVKKILYNIDLAEQTNDPRLFKKLTVDIWEFRVRYNGLQLRLLAFWDKKDSTDTLVIATHGFIKKSNKIHDKDLEHAERIRNVYLKNDKSI